MKAYARRIKRAEKLREWRKYVEKIAASAGKILGHVKVYTFGSAVEGKLIASSDVDILIVCDNPPEDFEEYLRVRHEILKGAGLNERDPFQLHIVDEERAKFYFEGLRVKAELIADR